MSAVPRPARALAALVVVCLLAAGCTDGDDDGSAAPPTDAAAGDEAAGDDDAEGGDGGPGAAEATGDPAECPPGFRDDVLEAGTHEGFASEGQDRSFHLLLPREEPSEPAPLFVSLTGTVQEEASFMEQSGIDRLPDQGWIVVAPVRNDNGLVWGPWDAMRTPDQTQPNPDEALVLDLVACTAAHHPVDPDRIFVGGISVGGTFVTYLLRRHSDLFAGGIVGSGNFILTAPADERPPDDMTVVVAWGGETDQWTGCPDGRMGEEYADEPGCVHVDFVPEAHATVEHFADEGAVDVLACAGDLGHIWHTQGTPYWADVLASRPKGTEEPLEVGSPPDDITCAVGAVP